MLDYFAFSVHQKLAEVPWNHSRLLLLVVVQATVSPAVGEQFVCFSTVDRLYRIHKRPGVFAICAVDLVERLNLFGRAWLLVHELAAGEPYDL